MTDLQTTDPETRPAALDQEYVVGAYTWYYRARPARALALPHPFDDITDAFGPDLYERMGNDSQVAACDTLLRASILEDGVSLSPAIDDASNPQYELATELVGFCEEQLEGLATALDDVLWDMLGCMSLGSRIAEITYYPFDQSPLPGRAMITSLHVKPPLATAFVVDAYMRVLGIAARQSSRPMMVSAGMSIDPLSEEVIDREKFAIASFRPRNNDPRGSSIYRAAYTPWWGKMQTWEEFLKYLAQFATPSIAGTTGEKATTGTDMYTGATISAVDALLQRLERFQNSSVFAGPHGTEIKLIFSTGEGKAFLNAFSLYNQEITKAITTQTLAAGEGEHASRAQAGVHQDALGTIIRQAKRAICRMLRRDVLRNCVRYNYGDAAARLTPMVSLGEVEQEDRATLISAMSQAGWRIDPSQFAAVDSQVNLPARVMVEEEAPADPSQPDATAESTNVQPLNEEPSLTNLRTAAAGTLIRAGFNAQDARAVVGLPPLRHTGRVSVATKPPETEPV